MTDEIMLHSPGYFKPGNRVKIFLNGMEYPGTVFPRDAKGFGGGYRGSDEVNVRCDEKVPESKYARGYGVIAAVASPNIVKIDSK